MVVRRLHLHADRLAGAIGLEDELPGLVRAF